MTLQKSILFRAAMLSAALLVILGFFYLQFVAAPEGSSAAERYIVPLNADLSRVPEDLAAKGFVSHPRILRFFLAGSGVEPGGYRISKEMNAWQMARVLRAEPYMRWVRIPEGYRKEEIAELLAGELSWDEEEKEAWLAQTRIDPDRFEGVYFPDTYLISKEEAPADVADRFRVRFEEQFAPYATEALKQNVKWPTVLKIASLVQREAAGSHDMPLIAGILWNRLLHNQKLDIDATLQYIQGKEGAWWPKVRPEDKQIDSPYNTYKYAGLPPTPIANPGLAAIRAVLYPQETTCLFYLHDASGDIHCSATYEGHLENIETYLR